MEETRFWAEGGGWGVQQTGLGTGRPTTPASAPVATTLRLSLAVLGVWSFQHLGIL